MGKVGPRLILPLLLALLATLVFPATASAVTYYSYANYTAGDDFGREVWGGNWYAQTFNTTTSHTINIIRLKLWKEGTPGTLTVSLRETDGSGHPTGTDLCSGTLNGTLLGPDSPGTWQDIIVDECTLTVNTTYAIVCKGTGTDGLNNIHWGLDTSAATYAGGNELFSSNSGTTWTAHATYDCMFNIFGSPTIELYGANVFKSYLHDGDWLITAKYKDVFEPYCSTQDSKDSFYLQLTKADDTLIAQVPLSAWGYKPASIYLSNITVASLEWDAAYKVKLCGIDAPHYNTTYTLTAGDWRGKNLSSLDDWCLSWAHAMETYYATTFVVTTSEKGDVLNQEGGVIFVTGIPYLDQVRPNIFQIATSGIDYEEPVWPHTYEESLPEWDVAVGSELAGILRDAGVLFNLSGKDIGIIIIFLLYAGIATGAFAMGHGTAGMALALPVLILGVYFRFIPFAVMGVAIAITGVLLVRQLWWRST